MKSLFFTILSLRPLLWILFIVILPSCSSSSDKQPIIIPSLKGDEYFNDSISKTDSLNISALVDDFDLNLADTFHVGDVNADSKNDLAIVNPANYNYVDGKIVNEYVNISFNSAIPEIRHNNGFHGLIVDAGDLDGNNTDELIYYPDWFQSNMATIYIYGLRQNEWILFGRGTIRRDILANQSDPIKYLKSRVNKIDNQSFKITEHIMEPEGGDFVDSTTIIIIK